MKRKTGRSLQVCEYCILLVMIGDTQRVPPCGQYPTLKSISDLKTLFEMMGLLIVKSTSNFPEFYVLFYKQFQSLHLYRLLIVKSTSNFREFYVLFYKQFQSLHLYRLLIVKSTSNFREFYVLFYKQFQSLHLYRTNQKKKLATQSNSNSKIKIKTNSSREATLN